MKDTFDDIPIGSKVLAVKTHLGMREGYEGWLRAIRRNDDGVWAELQTNEHAFPERSVLLQMPNGVQVYPLEKIQHGL